MWITIDRGGIININDIESLYIYKNKVMVSVIVEDVKRKILDRFDSEYEAQIVLKDIRERLMESQEERIVCSVANLKNYDLTNIIQLDLDAVDKTKIVALVKDTRRKAITLGEYETPIVADIVLEEFRARMVSARD